MGMARDEGAPGRVRANTVVFRSRFKACRLSNPGVAKLDDPLNQYRFAGVPPAFIRSSIEPKYQSVEVIERCREGIKQLRLPL